MYHLTLVRYMHRVYFWTFFIIILLSSCSKSDTQISISCEENHVGNNIIKWETTPYKEGVVQVYTGTSPYNILENKPIAEAKISDQRMIIINNNPSVRSFYSVVFNNEKRIIVGSRNINFPNVENFRDLGGYESQTERKKTKWGYIYRTGKLDRINDKGIARLKSLGIKTIVDLRPSEEVVNNSLLSANFNIVRLPINTKDTKGLLNEVLDQSINRRELKSYMKKVYVDIARNNNVQFKEVFKLLLDESNYPIVFACESGKRQVGVLSSYILSALGVNQDVIMVDYKRSNDFIDMSEANTYASNLPNSAQEALTALVLAQPDYLEAAIQEVKSSYGNVDSFFKEGLGLTDKDIVKLRSMLLE